MRIAPLKRRAYTYQRLLPQESPGSFNQDFASSAGMTFDSAKTVFSGGAVTQVDQTIVEATMGAQFSENVNLNWGLGDPGDLTGTVTGSAAIIDNKLSLTGGYVSFVATGKVNSDRGAIKFKITPNFDGSPAQELAIFTIKEAAGDNRNLIRVLLDTGGRFRVRAIASNGLSITSSQDFGAPVFVDGDEVEFEFNWNFNTPHMTLLLDGVLLRSFGFSGTMDDDLTTTTLFQIGSDEGFGTSDFSIRDLVFFQPDQHSTNYTPGYSVPTAFFESDLITIPIFTYVGDESIVGFTNLVESSTGGTTVYNINGLWFDGAAWSASNNTAAQMNPATTILTNIATLPSSDTVLIKLMMTNSNTIASTVSDLTLSYTGQEFVLNPTGTIVADPLIVSLDTFKSHIKRTGTTSEDALLTLFLRSAIKTGEEKTNRDFLIKSYQTKRDFFPQGSESEGYYYSGDMPGSSYSDANIGFELRKSPLVQVDSVTYIDEDTDIITTVDPTIYYNTVENDYSELLTNQGSSWPDNNKVKMQSITAIFQCGMNSNSTDFEAQHSDITLAILEHAAFLWANRGDCCGAENMPAISSSTYARLKIKSF